MTLLQHNDRNLLIDVNLRFLSWLGKNFPVFKDSCLPKGYKNFGEYVRKYPTSFWGDIGDHSYAELITKSSKDESILDKVGWYVGNTPLEINNEILVGFVEGHMFTRPDSPLAKELGKMIGRDLSGLC